MPMSLARSSALAPAFCLSSPLSPLRSACRSILISSISSRLFCSSISFRRSFTTLVSPELQFQLHSSSSPSPPILHLRDPLLRSDSSLGREFTVNGWIKSIRKGKTTTFLVLHDGFDSIQAAAESNIIKSLTSKPSNGAAVQFTGKLQRVVRDDGSHSGDYELLLSSMTVLGACPPGSYPLGKKAHSMEYLRSLIPFRSRSSVFSSVFTIRSLLHSSIIQYFQSNGFLQIAAPILTPLDCEGGGEAFQVKTNVARDPDTAFFGRSMYLSVSGQLYAEMFTNAFSRVYAFGPTFRAETRLTRRHLAEFWMLEPEIAFASVADAMNLAENLVKYLIRKTLAEAGQMVQLLEERAEVADGEQREPLRANLAKFSGPDPFVRVTYSNALEILQSAIEHQSQVPPPFPSLVLPALTWGSDLSSEHERYLTDVHFRCPVFVTHYPTQLKPFYMLQSRSDPHVVECFDLLWPGLGELIGGSARETDAARLTERINAQKLKLRDYQWYIDLREYGGPPHAGFGLGFERLVGVVTGMKNLRDTIHVPRAPQMAKF